MPVPKPDPAARYLVDPTSPGAAAKRDYRHSSWGDVASSAAREFVPTYTKAAMDAVSGLGSSAFHLFSDPFLRPNDPRFPTSPGYEQRQAQQETAARAQMRATRSPQDVIRTALPAGDPAHDPVAMARAIVGGYRDRYGNVPALKQSLASDPGSALMDLQSLVSIPAGGEGLAARIPGLAGRAARVGVRGAKVLERAVNPVGLGADALRAGSRAAQVALRGGPPLTKAGEFTPAALKAVSDAFPNGEITPEELANPRFREILASTFQSRGIKPASVKQAVLTYNNAPATRAAVTGERAPSVTGAAVQDATVEGRRAIAQNAQRISGAERPDTTALGTAFQAAHDAAKSKVGALYDAARENEGAFHPVFRDVLSDNLNSALKAENLPTAVDDLREFPDFKEAPNALDFLTGRVSKLADAGELTFPNLERIRQSLGSLSSSARGGDRHAISTMREALDKSVEDAIGYGFLEGGSSYAADDFAQARAAHKSYVTQFESPKTSNPAVRSALKALSSPDVDMAGVPAAGGAGATAQNILGRNLFQSGVKPHPNAGRLYSDLSNILGGDGAESLRNHVRQSLLQIGDDGTLVAKPAQVRGFLESPLADVFSPGEKSELRLLAAGEDVLGQKPRVASTPTFGENAGALGRRLVTAGAGAAVGTMFPGYHPLIETGLGAAGFMAEPALEHFVTNRKIGNQLRGAPATGAILNAPQAAGAVISPAARAIPLIHTAEEGLPGAPPPRPVQVEPELDFSNLGSPYDAAPSQGAETRPALPGKAVAPVDLYERYRHNPLGGSVPGAPNDAPDSDVDFSTIGSPNDDAAERPARASGGRVDIEPLILKLLSKAETAKRAENASTKPLLRLPDEAVATALRIASQAA